MTSNLPAKRRSGSALISTMLVLTVLTIIVVAFLQSMTVERQTARSYLNRYKAELAARAGLNTAIAKIQATLPKTLDEAKKGFITWTWGKDDSFDVTYTGILTDIFNTDGDNLGVDRTIWLLSCRSAGNSTDPKATAPDKLDGDSKNQFNVNNAEQINKSDKAILVDWVDLPNQPSVRYAYWASDEGGRLDITRIGNSANFTKNTGKLTDLKLPDLPTSEINQVLTKHELLRDLSTLTPRQVAPSLKNNPSSFGVLNNEGSDLINYGPMALQPRKDINKFFTDQGEAGNFVMEFDKYVSLALPDYYERKENYRKGTTSPADSNLIGTFKRIAASIYDYIDPSYEISFSPNLKSYFDGYATAISPWPGPGTKETTYYGIKPVPRINEYLVYYGTASETGKYSNRSIDVTRYLELWNMSQKPLKISSVTVRLFNQQRGGAAVPPLDELISNWMVWPPGPVPIVPTPAQSVEIPPNGFVTLMNTSRYEASLPALFDDFRRSLNLSSTGIILAASINEGPVKVVDGFYPLALQASASAGKAGVSPGYSGSGDTTDTRASLGLFLTKWSSVTGSAHSATPPSANNSASDRTYQNMKNWFDQPQMGAGQGVSPITAPAFIRGAKMDYIAELGNIWDPGKDLVDSTSRPRGGKTLVIGQFDPYYVLANGSLDASFKNYASYLKRGDAALLDIFTANDDARVNLNSPPPKREPARPFAVFGSSLDYPTSDIFPQGAKPTYDFTGLENAIIARLSTPNWQDARPFRNTNDLMTLDEDINSLKSMTGTKNFWSLPTSKLWKSAGPKSVLVLTPSGGLANLPIQVSDGNDQSREEAFRRISNWISFASLNFRIYAAGEVLDPKGKSISRTRLQAVVTFIPTVTKNADGTTNTIAYTPNIKMLPGE